MATALATLRQPTQDGALETLSAAAEIEQRLHEDAPEKESEKLPNLQSEFASQYLSIDGTAAQHAELQALSALLIRRSQDPEEMQRRLVAGGKTLEPRTQTSLAQSVPAGVVPPFPGAATAQSGIVAPGLQTSSARPERFDMSPPKLEFGEKQKDPELEKLRRQVRKARTEVSAQKLLQGTPEQGRLIPGTLDNDALLVLMETQTDMMREV